MEVSVRFNADIEKDFAFQVDREDRLKDKIARIFRKDGTGMGHFMVLRPTIFHKAEPTGFYKSMHPGYMTEGGCVLYDYDADASEYMQLLDEEKPVLEQVWPGQLILPKWDVCKINVFIYALIMLVWLYTDLPDCISPTPGICLTNNMSKLLIPVFDYLELYDFSNHLRLEVTPGYSSLLAQWGFFTLHVFKVLLITLFFAVGICNPVSFNPFRVMSVTSMDLTQPSIKNLVKFLGWVGIRRGTQEQYQAIFHEYIIKKYGNAAKASKAGMLRVAVNSGFPLSDGEGYQTPLAQRFEIDTFEKAEKEGKFYFSESYFIELENNLKSNVKKCHGDIGLMNAEVKRFRRFGLFEPNAKLERLVAIRKRTFEKVHEEQEAEVERKRLEKVAKRREEERIKEERETKKTR